MKKLILTCALLATASVVSFAQTTQTAQSATTTMQAQAPHQAPAPQTAEQRAERRARSEEKQLGLNADQYKTVYAADLEMMKKVDELRNSKTQPSRDQFMTLNKEREDKVKAVLTPEQVQKYESMYNRQHQAPNGAAPMSPAAPQHANN